MNIFPRLVLGALFGASSVMSAYAQVSQHPYDSSTPKTRAEVIDDLNDWTAAGYNPTDWIDYPDDALQAGSIVAARRAGATGAGGGAAVTVQ
jgi:hypothetical protein